MARIALNGKWGRGKFALVNDDIAEIVGRFHWFLGKGRGNGTGHVQADMGVYPYYKRTYLHRFAYLVLYGFLPAKGEVIPGIKVPNPSVEENQHG